MVFIILKGDKKMFTQTTKIFDVWQRIRQAVEISVVKKDLPDGENRITDMVNTILSTQGLSLLKLDFLAETEKILELGLTEEIIDQNSNKTERVIEGAFRDTTDSIRKIIGYYYLYRQLKQLYGKKEAKRLSQKLYVYDLAISDSTKILVPYCYSLDCSKIVMEGRSFGLLSSPPPQNLIQYIIDLNEVIHQISTHLAGAIAIGTFFLDIAHILLYKEKLTTIEQLNEKKDYLTFCFKTFIYSVNNLSRNAVESPFTNVSIFDSEKLKTFLQATEMGWYFQKPAYFEGTDKEWVSFVIGYIQEIQYKFIEIYDKGIEDKNGLPYRFPICTLNISKKTTEEGEISITDKDFVNRIAKTDIYRYNIFISEGTKVASCCRLLSDLDMISMGGQANSFGGSGISLGSHRVVVINFNRLALEAKSYEEYLQKITATTEDTAKILKAHKELLKYFKNLGYQPFLSNNFLRLDRMFSTYGVLGLVEANETIRKKFPDQVKDKDVLAESLILLNKRVNEFSAQYGIIGNIEQIPGETMAVKLCRVDKELFGEESVPYELYSNQFVPLWKDCSIWDRMELDGKYNKLFTGGGIVHFNLGEKVNESTVKRLINHAVESGCEHFALNSIYSQCQQNHFLMGKYEVCPQCQTPIVEYFTRVVGFFVPVSSWNKVRKEKDFANRHFTAIEELKVKE